MPASRAKPRPRNLLGRSRMKDEKIVLNRLKRQAKARVQRLCEKARAQSLHQGRVMRVFPNGSPVVSARVRMRDRWERRMIPSPKKGNGPPC